MMPLYTITITLIFLLDPLGNIPIFLSILHTVPVARRQRIIIRESLIALLILLFFLFFGQYIMEGMHISEDALTISGGIILFIIAIQMIFTQDDKTYAPTSPEPLIVPLAIPLFAGPAAMTMVMLLARQAIYPLRDLVIAILIAWLATTLILMSANLFNRILGERGLIAIQRLMGMILTTMAVQMFLTGLDHVLHA